MLCYSPRNANPAKCATNDRKPRHPRVADTSMSPSPTSSYSENSKQTHHSHGDVRGPDLERSPDPNFHRRDPRLKRDHVGTTSARLIHVETAGPLVARSLGLPEKALNCLDSAHSKWPPRGPRLISKCPGSQSPRRLPATGDPSTVAISPDAMQHTIAHLSSSLAKGFCLTRYNTPFLLTC